MTNISTPVQAAYGTGCAMSTLYRRAKRGDLTNVGAGARMEFAAEQVAALVARQAEAEANSVDIDTVVQRLGVARSTAYKLVYDGRLDRWPPVYREMRVSTASLERYLSTRQ